MYSVRNYRPEEFAMVESWWLRQGQVAPLPSMLPPESTFIVEKNNVPLYSLTVYLTNCVEIAYLENFVGNPDVSKVTRKLALPHLLQYVENFTKKKGHARLLCLAHESKLKARYQELGYFKTLDNVATLVKVL